MFAPAESLPSPATLIRGDQKPHQLAYLLLLSLGMNNSNCLQTSHRCWRDIVVCSNFCCSWKKLFVAAKIYKPTTCFTQKWQIFALIFWFWTRRSFFGWYESWLTDSILPELEKGADATNATNAFVLFLEQAALICFASERVNHALVGKLRADQSPATVSILPLSLTRLEHP